VIDDQGLKAPARLPPFRRGHLAPGAHISNLSIGIAIADGLIDRLGRFSQNLGSFHPRDPLVHESCAWRIANFLSIS
jgi:hypothetical protein